MILKRTGMLILCIALLLAMPVRAATITVTEVLDDDPAVDNGLCSLREAVITANTDTQVDACVREGVSLLDTIVFAASTDVDASDFLAGSGSAELSLGGAGEDAAMTGDLDITDGLRIIGNYDLAQTVAQEKLTLVTGAGVGFDDRIFHVHANVQLLLENLLITGGDDVSIGGGVMAAADSSLSLDNCVVYGNRIFSSNILGAGGGVYALGGLNLTDSLVVGNQARTTGAVVVSGGGIFAAGDLTMERVLVSDNRLVNDSGEARGAGIFYAGLNGGSLTMTDSHVEQNKGVTQGNGSGDFLGLGLYHAQGQATISGSAFSLQTISGTFDPANAFGAAIYSLDPMNLTNTTISNNALRSTAVVDGAGVFVAEADATLNLNNVTLFENSATNTAGVGLAGGISNSFAASVTLSNSIIAGNNANTASPDCRGSLTSAGYNLLGDDSDCVFMAATGDQVGTAVAPIDPVLAQFAIDPAASFEYPLASINVGLIAYHPLLEGSPALDAGDPMDPAMGGSCEIVDVRGESRPQDGDGDAAALCDMGAYEATPASADDGGGGTTNGGGGGGGSSSGGGCSLAEGETRLDPVLSLLVILALGWLAIGWLASRRARRSRPWK